MNPPTPKTLASSRSTGMYRAMNGLSTSPVKPLIIFRVRLARRADMNRKMSQRVPQAASVPGQFFFTQASSFLKAQTMVCTLLYYPVPGTVP